MILIMKTIKILPTKKKITHLSKIKIKIIYLNLQIENLITHHKVFSSIKLILITIIIILLQYTVTIIFKKNNNNKCLTKTVIRK